MSISIDYISKEAFENQPKQIQEVLENHFEGAFGLYEDIDGTIKHGYWTKDRVRLLTEGQLRQFIEDKTGCKVIPDLFGKEEYVIGLFYRGKNCFLDKADYSNLGTDLLQAYWKVAIEIIKEEIIND